MSHFTDTDRLNHLEQSGKEAPWQDAAGEVLADLAWSPKRGSLRDQIDESMRKASTKEPAQ